MKAARVLRGHFYFTFRGRTYCIYTYTPEAGNEENWYTSHLQSAHNRKNVSENQIKERRKKKSFFFYYEDAASSSPCITQPETFLRKQYNEAFLLPFKSRTRLTRASFLVVSFPLLARLRGRERKLLLFRNFCN